MSVLEELKAIEQRVTQRLRELEPLVQEYAELRKVADRLGIATPGGAPPPPAPPAPPQRPPARRIRRPPTIPPASRHDEVLAAVRARPGITVPEIGRELGVAPASLYRVVRRLEQQGHVTKQGRSVEPA